MMEAHTCNMRYDLTWFASRTLEFGASLVVIIFKSPISRVLTSLRNRDVCHYGQV